MSGIEHSKERSAWYKRFPCFRGCLMQENEERWKQLCEQAAKEQDPDKLMDLIAEINRLLAAKDKRLRGSLSGPDSGAKP
ncbi:MAG TPA: hypothetical protein VEU94_17430 [Terriglobales bacterium]|nr:hypothetical protein [Terriglobales bacterium]